MYEELYSTTFGCDEAKAYVVLPCGNSTLMAHIDPMKGLYSLAALFISARIIVHIYKPYIPYK
jgi:hypothetical protein